MISITSYAKGKKSSQSSGNGGGGGFANAQIYNNGFNPFYLWGQYIDGRDSINGDLISNGTINGNKFVGEQGNIDLIYALSEYVNYISGHTAVFDNLSGDTAHFNQDVFVGGDIDIVGDTNITGDTTIYGDLAVSGDTHLKNVWTQNINNSDTIKTKNLEVSGLAHFFQLVIDRIKAAGGAILLTPADGFETALVEEDASGYTLYFHAKDGERQISNMWEVNDQAICQTFNASTGTSYNVSNTYYWALVTEVSEQAVQKTVSGVTEEYHYIKLSKSVYDGELNPKVGDEIAMLGSRNDEDPQRQSAIYMAAYTSLDQGLTAPCFAEYKGINDFSLSSHRHSYIDATGASFTGDFRIDNNTTIQDYVNSATTEIRNEFRFDTEGLYSRVSKMTNPNILPANGWTDQDDKALLQEDDEEYIFEEPQQQSMAKGGFSEDVVSEDLIGMPPIIYLNADTYTFSIYSQVKFEDIQYGYTKDNLNMTLPVQTAFNSGDTWHSQARAITTFVAPIDGYYHLGAKMMGSDYTGDYEWVDPDGDGESGYTPSESAITTTIHITMNQGTTILINSTGNKATATITPSDFAGNVVWASSNPNAATIDQQGNITIVGTGTTTISASIPEQYHNGKHYLGSTDSLSLAVTDQVQTEVTLTAPSVMEYGSSENYAVATVTPSSYNGQVQYSTSNSNIATIDSDGNITLVNAGQFTIYAVAPQTIQNGVTYLASSASTLCRVTRESQSVITFETASGDHVGSGTSQTTMCVICDISPFPATSAITITVDGDSTWGETAYWNFSKGKCNIFVGKGSHTINVSVAEYQSGEMTYLAASASTQVNFFQRQSGVSISATAPSEGLTQGDTYNLSASTVPSGAHLTYTSDDTTIATVNSGGTITAVSTGSTYVTIHADEFYDRTNYYYYPSADSGQYNVVVNNTQNITITNLTPSTFTEYGEWFDLSATTTPETTLTYSSSNPSVISVDEDGIIQALETGSATITITAQGFKDNTSHITYLTTTKTINVQATVAEIPQNVMPNNEIWYTNTSGITIDFNPTAFGDNLTVVSNTYNNDKGVLVLSGIARKVEGRVTANEDDVFELTSIHLPASVASMKGSALGCDHRDFGAMLPSTVTPKYLKNVYLYTNKVPKGFTGDINLYAERNNNYDWSAVSPNKDTYPLPMGAYGWVTYPQGVQCYHMQLEIWLANYHVLPKAVNDFSQNKFFNKYVTNNYNKGYGYVCQELSDYTVSASTLNVNATDTYITDQIAVFSSAYTASHSGYSGLTFQSFSATTANANSTFTWDGNEKKYKYHSGTLTDDTITINFENMIDGNGVKFLGSGTITIPVAVATVQNVIQHDILAYPFIEGNSIDFKGSANGAEVSYSSSNPNVAAFGTSSGFKSILTGKTSGSTVVTMTTPRFYNSDNNTVYESAITTVNVDVEARPQYQDGYYGYLRGAGTSDNIWFGYSNIDLRNYSIYIDNNGRQGEGISGSTTIMESWEAYMDFVIEYPSTGGLHIGYSPNSVYNKSAITIDNSAIYDRNVISVRRGDGFYLNDTKIGNIVYEGGYNQFFRGTTNLKIYGVKLYNGNTLAYDFKPYVKNGRPGLYDSATDTFIGSTNYSDNLSPVRMTVGDPQSWTTSAQTISYTALPSSGLTESETHNLNASAQGTLSYTSSNPSVATVSSNGIISALTSGNTTITITASAYDDSVNFVHYTSATTSVNVEVSEPQPLLNPLTDSKYFVIQARSATTLTIESVSSPTGTTAYRKNSIGEWTTANINANTDISLAQGDYLEFKGNIKHANNKYYRFKTSVAKSIDCGGYLAALEKNTEIDSSNNTVNNAFCCLFSGCTGLVNAQDLKLPDNTTTDMCRTFFRSCTNLVTIPQLPVPANGTIAVRAYQYMFADCTSLTTPPVLSASTVSENSYAYMFYQCKFVTPPELPATNLAKGCYGYMFSGCNNLKSAPTLPATTLAESCYQYMFRSCTKLENAPIISATTLAKKCCYYMFNNCSKLVTAPQLPVTTLADSCYERMFDSCTSLVNPPSLPATTLTNGCYQGMFNGCTKLTTAPDLPATTLVNNCYYYMFTGCKALTSLRVGFSTISGTTPLTNWLNNITTTGVCYCPSNAEYSASDISLPSNWTLSKTL